MTANAADTAGKAEIVALVERYVGYSEGMNFAAKRALWDGDEPAPLLMPEEAPAPLIGWPAIDAYWAKSRVVMETLKSRTANHRVRLMSPDIALVTYDMRWVATLAGPKDVPRKPIAADVRVTALLRKKPDGWRYFHLMEGPIDLAGMTRLAMQAVADTLSRR
ncbi:MAG: nuclear transport factor 2 family protein [Rhodobacteraceae bacterium]|nr:nuclear transport factor 2 family protein [Paracoccaceae bacterium]